LFAQQSKQDSLLNEMLFVKTEVRQKKINAFLNYFSADSAGTMQAYKIIGAHGRKHGDVLLEFCEASGLLSIVRNSKTASNALVSGYFKT
jgi:hypothetical protein